MSDLVLNPRPTYLIIEQIHAKSGLPSVTSLVGVRLYAVFRRVARIYDVQDIYVKGQRISGMPSDWQVILDAILPGQRITTKPTGETRIVLEYAGFKNIAKMNFEALKKTLQIPLDRDVDFGRAPAIFTYGTDPIPTVELYGNPKAEFVMPGGNSIPVAIGIYDPISHTLDIPPANLRGEVIKRLLQADPSMAPP